MRKGGKSKGVVKGAPSGFMVSLAVHAAAEHVSCRQLLNGIPEVNYA